MGSARSLPFREMRDAREDSAGGEGWEAMKFRRAVCGVGDGERDEPGMSVNVEAVVNRSHWHASPLSTTAV
jgi:hypothetical protein